MKDAEARNEGGTRIGFGPFEVDPRAGELRKDGRKVRIQDKPLRMLEILLERPGEVVSREELVRRLWPDGVFVDFDNSLNAAARKLRTALGDSAANPRYLATVARGGYRYIGPAAQPLELELAETRSRSPRAFVLAVAFVAALPILWWALVGRERGAASDAQESGLAVLPFTVRGSEGLAYLEAGLVDLLTTTLDSPAVPTVDSHALLGFLERERPELDLHPEEGARVARRFGASEFVLGTVVAAGTKIRMQATLYQSASATPLTHGMVEGSPDDLFYLVDGLSGQLLAGRLRGPTELERVTTESLPALKHYLEGERIYRDGRIRGSTALDLDFRGQAKDAFLRATEEDPTFALAWLRAAQMIGWFWRTDPTFEYLEQARAHADRLSDRERLRLEAIDHLFRGRSEEAIGVYEEILKHRRDDAESWHQLGVTRHFYNWRVGRSPEEAREPYQRALALDPDNFDILWSLRWLATWYGPPEQAAELSRKLSPEENNLTNELSRAFLENDVPAQIEVRRELAGALGDRSRRGDAVFAVLFSVPPLLAFDRFTEPRLYDAAIELAEILTAAGLPPGPRSTAHIVLANLAAGRGRWDRARQQLEVAESLKRGDALTFGSLVALAPGLDVPESHLSALESKLEAWDGVEGFTVYGRVPVAPEFGRVLRTYFLGLVSARLGESDDALRYSETLDSMSGPRGAESVPRDYARTIRAVLARNAGDSETALALLEKNEMKALPGQIAFNYSAPFFQQIYARFLRAELLEDLGRPEEALGWYEGLGWIEPAFEQPYEIASLLRRSEIYDRLGQPKLAEAYRQSFRQLRDAPP